MMDKTLEIKRIGNRPVSAADVVSLLDAAGIAPVRLDSANWSESFPYKPEVNFRIGHTGDAILIAWTANEKNVRGVASDNGAVWEDSCVEFFISFNGGDSYYNIECNCRCRQDGPRQRTDSRPRPGVTPLISRTRRVRNPSGRRTMAPGHDYPAEPVRR